MVQGEILLVQLLRYANELRDPDEFDIPEGDLSANRISKKELDMAERLVEGMTEKWDPRKYHDSYRDDLMALIEKKIKAGRSLTITEPEPEPERPRGDNVIDLMKLLKRSLEETGKPAAKGASARKTNAASKAVTVKRRARAQA